MNRWWVMAVGFVAAGCAAGNKAASSTDADPCDSEGALSSCVQPAFDADYYIEQSQLYFNTMDTSQNMQVGPDYGEKVVRWEWPPWLLLTAFGREHIQTTDTFLQLFPSTIPQRDCRFFEEQPFGRCRVVFYYDDHDGRPCPIYEEFSFNEQGEMTFIEAWSDLPGYLPMDGDADPWANGEEVTRLSSRVPGLGNAEGLIDLDGEAMAAAMERDPDVADLVARAGDWATYWAEAYAAAGDNLWSEGCGWSG